MLDTEAGWLRGEKMDGISDEGGFNSGDQGDFAVIKFAEGDKGMHRFVC